MPLSAAEERGLYGLSLDSRVRQAFLALPPSTVQALVAQLTTEAFRRSFIYVRAGQAEAIPAMLRPCLALPDQLVYMHTVSLCLLNALKRLPELYLQESAVRAVVPLTPPEEQWLREYWGPSQSAHNPVLARLDAVIDFTSPMWKDSLQFMEPNLSSVGGLHLAPVCEQMISEVVVPALQQVDPTLQLTTGPDLREQFLQEAVAHLMAIGRKGRTLCLIEPKYAGDGPAEQAALVEYYQSHHGLTVCHADPAELYLQNGEVCYEGQVVDLGYRDYEVRDLLAIELEDGIDTRPLRALFQQNRIMSSLTGEFDHKSCWELLTEPTLARKYFSTAERQVFQRHVLWTRYLAPRYTTLPEGALGDLLEFTRKQQELLVIKPNRSYGGDRVIVGATVSPGEWEAAIELAVQGAEHGAEYVSEQWVVQRLTRIPVQEFPVVTPEGAVNLEPFYTVMGLVPTRTGLSMLGRASQKLVVNVAQRGGLCAVLVGEPPAK